MKINNFDLNFEQNVQNANLVKDLVLEELLRDNVISREDFEKYAIDYNVFIFKASWFKRLMIKLNYKEDSYYYKYTNINK